MENVQQKTIKNLSCSVAIIALLSVAFMSPALADPGEEEVGSLTSVGGTVIDTGTTTTISVVGGATTNEGTSGTFIVDGGFQEPARPITSLSSFNNFSDHAKLSSDVYSRYYGSGHADKRVLGTGYELVTVPDTPKWTATVGRLYVNRDIGKAVIAYAGTECGTRANGNSFNECILDIASDATLKKDDIYTLPFLKRAIEFSDKALAMLAKEYNTIQIEVTGHSLGGALAQIVSAKYGWRAVTFNSAPIKIGPDRLDYLNNGGVNKSHPQNINFRNKYDPLSNLGFGPGPFVGPYTGLGAGLYTHGFDQEFNNGVGVGLKFNEGWGSTAAKSLGLQAHSMGLVSPFFQFMAVSEQTGKGDWGLKGCNYDNRLGKSLMNCIGVSGTQFMYTGNSAKWAFGQGSIHTNDSNAPGIYVYMPNELFGNQQTSKNKQFDLTFNAPITTTGGRSPGITSNIENGQFLLTNSGSILTKGTWSSGVLVNNGERWEKYNGKKTLQIGGDISLLNNGAIYTQGDLSNAIDIVNATSLPDAAGNINIAVRNGGELRTSGSKSIGIAVNPKYYYGTNIPQNDNDLGRENILVINRISGKIKTSGKYAHGIQVQGQLGDLSLRNMGSIDLTGRGSFGVKGMGGDKVELVNKGSISVDGLSSAGLWASAYGERDAKNPAAIVNNSGSIRTKGAYSRGIEAHAASVHGSKLQVLNSGAINVYNSGSIGINVSGGASTITSSGGIIASANNSFGIVADGSSQINIEGGTVQGGSGTANFSEVKLNAGSDHFSGSAGILIVDGEHRIDNKGAISGLNGIAIAAFERSGVDDLGNKYVNKSEVWVGNEGKIHGDIILGSGDDKVYNGFDGLISGNVLLGAGYNRLYNTGIFHSGDQILLGAGNPFENNGQLDPGGPGKIQKTTIDGDFEQSADGELHIDIDDGASQKSDRLKVSGKAILSGTVVANLLSKQSIASEYLIIETAGGAKDNGVVARDITASVADPVGYDFGLEYRNGTNVFLTAQPVSNVVEIAKAAVDSSGTSNINNLAMAMDTIGLSGDMAELINRVRLQPTNAAAAALLSRLTPHQSGQQATSALNSNINLGNAMLSCRQRDGSFAYTSEGQCYWGKIGYSRIEQNATDTQNGSVSDTFDLTGGVQFALQEELRLGFGFGYGNITSAHFDKMQSLGEADGHRFHAGVVAKNQWGAINAYFNLVGSYGRFDNTRVVGDGVNATSTREVYSGTARARFSYLFDQNEDLYFKPMVDISATHLKLASYSEKGAGIANLVGNSVSTWNFGVTPALELGGEIALNENLLLRPFVRVGYTILSKDSIDTTSAFAAAPDTTFKTKHRWDQRYVDLEAGVDLLNSNDINIRLNYIGSYSGNAQTHGGNIKASIKF